MKKIKKFQLERWKISEPNRTNIGFAFVTFHRCCCVAITFRWISAEGTTSLYLLYLVQKSLYIGEPKQFHDKLNASRSTSQASFLCRLHNSNNLMMEERSLLSCQTLKLFQWTDSTFSFSSFIFSLFPNFFASAIFKTFQNPRNFSSDTSSLKEKQKLFCETFSGGVTLWKILKWKNPISEFSCS